MRTPLLPIGKSGIPWQPIITSDTEFGGGTEHQITKVGDSIEFGFKLVKKVPYPFLSFVLRFSGEEPSLRGITDLSAYSIIKFHAACSYSNVLSLTIFTYDKNITTWDESDSFRMPAAYFLCQEKRAEIEVDLRHLEIPEWWLEQNTNLSDRGYDLSQSASITFGSSVQSSIDKNINVVIDSLFLEGRDWRYVYAGVLLLACMWLGAILLCFRFYSQVLAVVIKNTLQKDRGLVAYQQLTMQPHKDREKAAILRFMVTEYSNPDMSLDAAIAKLGVNRLKINEALKSEIGLTFNAYLNKIRLTEAARLLTENRDANISEVAYSVGYNSVSYFNRLFKSEYGCTPKVFQEHSFSGDDVPIGADKNPPSQ